MKWAYYNEIDPMKAETIREAIKAGAIAPGDVDERSIADVQPSEPASGDNALGAGLEGYFGDVREWRGSGWLDPHEARSVAEAGATRGFWADCDWWYGRDGKYRPIGQGINPLIRSAQRGVLALAHGGSGDVGLLLDPSSEELETAEARVGRLKLYGDAIVVPVAVEFIKAYLDVAQEEEDLSLDYTADMR
jgi:hypothetical protein